MIWISACSRGASSSSPSWYSLRIYLPESGPKVRTKPALMAAHTGLEIPIPDEDPMTAKMEHGAHIWRCETNPPASVYLTRISQASRKALQGRLSRTTPLAVPEPPCFGSGGSGCGSLWSPSTPTHRSQGRVPAGAPSPQACLRHTRRRTPTAWDHYEGARNPGVGHGEGSPLPNFTDRFGVGLS